MTTLAVQSCLLCRDQVSCQACGTEAVRYPTWYSPEGATASDRFVRAGKHPTGQELAVAGTCGSCQFSFRHGRKWRCSKQRNRQVVKRWRACTLFDLPSD